MLQSRTLNKSFHLVSLYSGQVAISNSAIVVCNGPSSCLGIRNKTGNQMKMKVLSTFTKGNGINTITTAQRPNQMTGLLNCLSPRSSFFFDEINRSAAVTKRVE